MGVLDRLLRVGEGKKLKALASLVPDVTALEPEIQALSDDALRAKTPEFRRAARQRRRSRRPADRGVRRDARGRPAGHRPASLRRAAHGRRGPALRLGRRDEDRRGKDPRLHPAGLSQRPGRPGHAPRHDERVPGSSRLRVDGPDPPVDGSQRRPDHPGRLRPGVQARAVRVRLTYGTNNEFGFDYLRDNMATSVAGKVQRGHVYCDRRRGRLDPHRRGAHAAHHQRPRGRRREALLPVRQHRPRASDRDATTTSTKRSARSPRPKRASSESSKPSASTTSTTR